jgi:hypothetical protein
MDRVELMQQLQHFREECVKRGYPLKNMCLKEVDPGDRFTSYFLRVGVDWVWSTGISSALDILIDVLWDTTDVETRKNIFAIDVRDGEEKLDCMPDSVSTLSVESASYS